MRFSHVAGVLATTGSVGAFLIPPTVSVAESDIVKALPIHDAAVAFGEPIVQIACPGCPVDILDSAGQVQEVSTRIASALRFKYHIKNTEDGDQLMLNDVQIYPMQNDPARLPAIKADQLVHGADGTPQIAGVPDLGYVLTFEKDYKNKDELNLITLHLEIVQVHGKDVTIPATDIKLLETASKKLMIGAIVPGKTIIKANCTTMMCRWKAIVADKISKLKGCGRKPKHSTGQTNTVAAPSQPATRPWYGHPRPHGHHRGPHHHGHRQHGGFARFMRSMVFHVLLPIILGAAMGVTASVVGIIVGHLAIFVWRALFRRNQRVERTEAGEGKEASDGLLDHQAAPPVYEEAPAYEEAVLDEKQ